MSKLRFSSALIAIFLVLTLLCAVAVAKGKGSSSTSKKQGAQVPDPAVEGEKLFQINCGRCHKPPESISPRISKSILQHMRVRAMLSQRDEELILKYIAP